MSATNDRRLRVAVLTRTGRSSGMTFAAAIRGSRHELCGVVAEKRSVMIRRMWRNRSVAEFVQKFGWRLLAQRGLEVLAGVIRRPEPQDPEAENLPVTVVEALNSPETVALLKSWRPDVLLVANAPVLKPQVFECAALAAVNFHSGQLPEYGGVASEFWAMHDGRAEAWATLHRVDRKLDSGAIFAEEPVPIQPGDTPETLHARLIEKAAEMIPRLLDRLAGDGIRIVREPGPATLRPWPSSCDWRELKRRRAGRAQPGQFH